MARQFWVNNYFIDVTRNQIQHQQQATPLPPKALKVLEVLAARAGEVVSHDELMDLVWQKSVVGPNTLQRAIAQLRKAFGDDSKQQAFIKTHAKQGYSLEAHVRWEENSRPEESQLKPDTPQQQETHPNPQSHSEPQLKFIYLVAATIFIVILAYLIWPAPQTHFDKMTPLTASDEQEFNASYSPDGNYLVFNRYMGQCESHLWAKDLTNNQEERLSTEPGHYSELSWSTDGSQLAFVLQSDCSDKPEQTQQCWQLQTLDFAEAWNGNANSLTRHDCKEIKTTHPTWLNDGRIALLQYSKPDTEQPNSNKSQNNQPKLVIYDAVTNQLEQVPHDVNGRIYSLDYSRSTELLATVSVTDKNEHIVRTLTVNGEVQSEAEVNYKEQYSVYDSFPVSFSPDGEHFLTNINGQIYKLTLEGDLERVHADSYSGLWTPVYHPGQTKFAATFGSKDFDIGTLKITNAKPLLNIFARSTATEANAQFQPNGDLIAFFSRRSGKNQLWLLAQESSYQLTHFEQGIQSARFSWSPNGKTLAVNLNHQLALVNLDGSHKVLEMAGASVQSDMSEQRERPIAVETLMPWTNPTTLLVTDNQTDKQELFSIDINTGEITDLGIQHVLWAAYDAENNIIYADHQADFWLKSNKEKSNAETRALSALSQKLFGNNLLIKDGHLYGIDPQAQLWNYDIKNNELQTIATLDKDIIYVSDIKGEQMLATKFIGGRRELVEFSKH